ncbi:MAG: energy-coupling factor transporter transmembrane protein EcfT [Ruminococcaceae bacterium]|nr:energy-coupling factor transporter transmembrane protein EcfT [Oscillospiraceae bacterium]
MLKDITFGQYIETRSPIHKADPRVKMILLIVAIVFIFLSKNFFALGVSVLLVLTVMTASKVPFKMYFKNLKAVLPIILVTSLINMFYGDEANGVLLSFWKITITYDGLSRAMFMALRIILLIIVSSTLTYTTTPNDLTDGIESLLSPLRFIGLKSAVHMLALMMTIALRFIPTLVEEAGKIMNAQKARGADLENGKLKDRIKALIPILIPLLLSSVRRAYELAEAMECRCYNGGEGKTRMKQLKVTAVDYVLSLVSLLFGAGIILCNIFL